MYFGELGEHSTTMIDYFHARTELRCDPTDNPAEFILEAIGAGASSKATLDWHALWCESAEFRETQTQIDLYHSQFKGKESAADATADSKLSFAASFSTQFKAVIVRAFQNYWRDPTYIMAKIMLNIVAGLFIGFSFYKSPDNVAGLQNKLFAVFMAVVLAAPLSQQLQPKFIGLRVLYQARERPAAMYSWPVLVLSSIVVEIPFNLFACVSSRSRRELTCAGVRSFTAAGTSPSASRTRRAARRTRTSCTCCSSCTTRRSPNLSRPWRPRRCSPRSSSVPSSRLSSS